MTQQEIPHASSAGAPPFLPHPQIDLAWLARRQEEALEPDLPVIDAHHHLWDRGPGYLLDDLLQDLGGHRVVATVFAQCGHAYRNEGPEELRPVGETEFVARVGEEADRRGVPTRVCAGIVAYADMELGERVAPVLQAHIAAGRGRLRGIRHITARHDDFQATLLGRPDADLMARPAFRAGLRQLQRAGLTFDAWLYHTQIGELVELAQAMPELPIVLNHCGGPLGVGPYAGRLDLSYREWSAAVERLSRCPNVSMKVGGLAIGVAGFRFHEQALPPSSEELADAWRPYVERLIELFGPRRCMFESDFPVDKALCSYTAVWNAFKRITSGASAEERNWLFKETANQFYRLGIVTA
jgi:L-fuconolactonase